MITTQWYKSKYNFYVFFINNFYLILIKVYRIFICIWKIQQIWIPYTKIKKKIYIFVYNIIIFDIFYIYIEATDHMSSQFLWR